jgi:hypothetical protein
MIAYYIYHLTGVKVGCTINIDGRGSVLREDSRYDNSLQILETIVREFDDEISWQLAGDHEREWQTKLGYSHDPIHYAQSRKDLIIAAGKGGRAGGHIGGKTTGSINAELNRGCIRMDRNKLSEAGKKGGKKSGISRLGKKRGPYKKKIS